VRSPQAEALKTLLGEAGITAVVLEQGLLAVAGAPASRVGEIAAAHGVVLHELVTEESSLEEVFLALTQGGDGS
jgi:ABC-2 type transport system ATP-binding protein